MSWSINCKQKGEVTHGDPSSSRSSNSSSGGCPRPTTSKASGHFSWRMRPSPVRYWEGIWGKLSGIQDMSRENCCMWGKVKRMCCFFGRQFSDIRALNAHQTQSFALDARCLKNALVENIFEASIYMLHARSYYIIIIISIIKMSILQLQKNTLLMLVQ